MAGPGPPDQDHQGRHVEEEGAAEHQQAPDVVQLGEAGTGLHGEV